MTRRIDPDLPLLCGFFVAPLVCALNATLGALMSGVKLEGLWFPTLIAGVSAVILTAPLGLLTMWVVEFWNRGQHLKARWFALGCGFACVAFFAWSATALDFQLGWPIIIGGLLLPWLWSIGFFVFACFARPPKN